jgi:hypothetical protein
MEMFFLEILTWAFRVEDWHKIAPYKLGILFAMAILLAIVWRTHTRVKKVSIDHCNRGQAQIVFRQLSELHRHKIEDFFYRNFELIQITKSVNNESILNQYDDFFRMLQDTGANELSHFNLNGRVLGEFLNGCSSEYMAIKNHLLKVTMSELEEDKKDASFFLKRKFDSINASFGKWLKVKTEVINEN